MLVSVPSKMPEVKDYDSEEKPQEMKSMYHVNARNFLYPSSYTIRFPVPDEKVPWEVGVLAHGEQALSLGDATL